MAANRSVAAYGLSKLGWTIEYFVGKSITLCGSLLCNMEPSVYQPVFTKTWAFHQLHPTLIPLRGGIRDDVGGTILVQKTVYTSRMLYKLVRMLGVALSSSRVHVRGNEQSLTSPITVYLRRRLPLTSKASLRPYNLLAQPTPYCFPLCTKS
jgi:hypothetical protein